MEIKIYKTIILSVVWYWCETWSCTLREEHMLGMVRSCVPRKILESNRAKVMGDKKTSITRSFIIFTCYHIQTNEDEMGGARGTCVEGKKCIIQGSGGKT
jgi:hypothetical protein